MNKNFFSNYLKVTTIFTVVVLNGDAKQAISRYNDTLKQTSIIIYNSNFSKRPAVLMRDTTLSGNRFDYQWHKRLEETGKLSKVDFQPAFVIDSALAARCDSMFISDPNSSKIKLTGWPKKTLSTLTRKNIRLYIGYIDDKGNKNVVVQFVSLKVFKRNLQTYSKELFLVVPRKELHFAVINLGY